MKRHARASSAGSTEDRGSRPGRLLRGALAIGGGSLRDKGTAAPSGRRTRRLFGAALALAALIALGAATAIADTAPTPTTEAASAVGFTTVHVSGHVNPNGGPSAALWHFQYREASAPEEEGSWVQPNADQEITPPASEESNPVKVEDNLAGLHPSTAYLVRLVASNEGGANPSISAAPFLSFTTKAVAKPTVSVDPVTTFSATSADFSGTVTAGGTDPAFDASCGFEYVTAAHFSSEGFTHPNQIACDANPVTGTGSTAVHAEATGLEPNTTYHLRLRAENLGGEESAVAPTFITSQTLPTALASSTTPESQSKVLLRGAVNPLNSSVADCHFAYGPASGGFEHTVPCEGTVSGAFPVAVTADLSGLSTGFSGHFEVVITTAGGGPVASEPAPFVTFAAPETETCPNRVRREEQHSTFLSRCRAYELVTPAQKGGASISSVGNSTRAAVDGEAAEFSSLQGFGNTRGTAVSAPYIAERDATPGTQGWVTHGIIPQSLPENPLSISQTHDAQYEGDFSPDLDKGVFSTLTPLTDEPETSEVANLYLREDLLSSEAESTRLLTPCPICADSTPTAPLAEVFYNYHPLFAGSTADLGQVVFQANRNLTADAPAEPASCASPSHSGCKTRIYESDHGTLRLVGRIPPPGATECDDSGAVHCLGAAISEPGHGMRSRTVSSVHTPNTISSDGRKVFFTVPSEDPNSENFEDIYMRLDHTSTAQIDASERTACLQGHESCQPAVPARLEAISADGSRVFFNDAAQLTNEPCVIGAYVYQTTLPASDPHNLHCLEPRYEAALSVGSEAQQALLVGTSTDGSWAYFLALLPHSGEGQPPALGGAVPSPPSVNQQFELYVWHEGEVRPVGSLNRTSGVMEKDLPWGGITFEVEARVSPSGGSVLFVADSDSGLTGQANPETCIHGGTGQQLYLYRAATNSLTCVSSFARDEAVVNQGAAQISGRLTRPLSLDGEHVFFETAERLVPEDTDGATDVYEYDAADGSPQLISSGTDSDGSQFLEATPDGTNVFFSTGKSLVGWDTNSDTDLYDARTGGGFPEPLPVPAPCEGEACRTTSAAPGAASPASQSFTAPAQPTCKKSFLEKHGKCVKKKQSKNTKKNKHKKGGGKKQKRANSNRGGQK